MSLDPNFIVDGRLAALLCHQATLSGTAATIVTCLGQAVPAGTLTIVLQPEGDDLRYWEDGSTPTVGAGMILKSEQQGVFTAPVAQFATMKVIPRGVGGGGPVYLNITCYAQTAT